MDPTTHGLFRVLILMCVCLIVLIFMHTCTTEIAGERLTVQTGHFLDYEQFVTSVYDQSAFGFGVKSCESARIMMQELPGLSEDKFYEVEFLSGLCNMITSGIWICYVDFVISIKRN